MTRPLRILHCLRAPVGGLFRHVLDLAREQARLGHAVGIVADSTSGNALTSQKFSEIAPCLELGLHLVPMSRAPGFGDAAAAFRTARIARRVRAGVLHGHGAKGGAFARLAAAGLKPFGGPACYYTPHGGSLHFDPASVEGRVYLGLEKLLLAATNGLIFESRFSERVYGDRIGGKHTARRVIPNGLSAADFAPHVPDEDAADLVFIGELRLLKGVDVLLAAIADIRKSKPLRAVIVGDGPDRAVFEAQALELGLRDCVTFTGALPARTAFTRGRVLVVPSRAESFPYIVLEAAAAGIPLVASNVGGIPEICAGTATPLVAPGDPVALARALQAVLTDPVARRKVADTLRAEVARKFTVEAMTAAVLAFQDRTGAQAPVAHALTQS